MEEAAGCCGVRGGSVVIFVYGRVLGVVVVWQYLCMVEGAGCCGRWGGSVIVFVYGRVLGVVVDGVVVMIVCVHGRCWVLW